MKINANKYNENDVVRIIREWTGLTQGELAKQLGYKTYHTIQQIENGTNKISFNKIMEIARKNNIKVTFEKR